jgi:hypothetical protein
MNIDSINSWFYWFKSSSYIYQNRIIIESEVKRSEITDKQEATKDKLIMHPMKTNKIKNDMD